MGPELELNATSDGITSLYIKENGSLSVDPKDECQRCERNCKDHALEMNNCISEPLSADRNKDVEVNITDFAISDGNGLVGAEGQDATESFSLSSFDDTVSGSADEAKTCDAEDEKIDIPWRTFIQPLMWRCKWVDLQVKKLRSQALKYDRELSKHCRRKHYLLENLPVECFGMKSLPYPSDGPADKVLRRKKRRMVEETTDVTSYMSHHNLFSYFENRIHTADGAYLDRDWGSQVSSAGKINGNDESEVKGERLRLELGVGDNSLEELLRKIWLFESQVSKLKFRLDKVINEDGGKFSSINTLGFVVLSNLTSSGRPPDSPPNNGDRMPVGSSNIASQLLSHYNTGIMVVPEGAISSHGQVSYIPDVIEVMDQSQFGGARIKTEDKLLIYDERLKQGGNNFDEVHIQPMEKLQVSKEEPHSTVIAVLAGSDQQTDNQPASKVQSIANLTATKSRRKKGRRKAASGRQSRRSFS